MKVLRPDQHRAKELYLERLRYGCFMQPGLGKTLTLCDTVSELMTPGSQHYVGDGRTLVVAPRGVIWTAWVKEWREGFKQRHGFDCTVLWHDDGKRSEKLIASDWRLGVINLEGYKYREACFRHLPINVLVIDESTKIKSEQAKATESMKRLAARCKAVYLLSGEPHPNDESELYSQITTISPGAFAPYTSWWHFFNHYFFQPKHEMDIKLKSGRVIKKKIPVARPRLKKQYADDFWDKVRRHCHFVKKEEVLDLPPKTPLVRHVELEDDERRAYQAVLASLRIELGGKVINAAESKRVMKLRQITAGFSYEYDEDGARIAVEIGRSKIREILDMVTGELGKENVVIWGTFKAEIDRIAAALKEDVGPAVAVHGDVGQTARNEAISAFNNGKIRFMVAHPATLGHGTDGFQNHCCHAIYASLDDSWDTHNQSMDRLHRVGQRNPCFYHYLLAPGRYDEVIYQNLGSKKTQTEIAHDILSAGE